MRSPFAHSPEFQRLLKGEAETDLFRIALEIARDLYPELDLAHYEQVVSALASRVRERCPARDVPRSILGQINWVLYVEEGFEGDTDNYFDPRNSFLNEVIDRKRGIPISLSVLYAAVARRVGLAMRGVNLPAHFMLRVGTGAEAVFVDPFQGGALLDRRGCEQRITQVLGRPTTLSAAQLAPCNDEQVVARMLRNLKLVYLRADEHASALPIQRRLAALRPGILEEQRDLGMLCLRMDRPAEAIEPLQTYLNGADESEEAESLRALLREARRTVALWN
ncbi:MAG: transglutaminase-like domain-containing protein [Isosphaeraceae bacterium]|nr:transglutaminase-like domain-containing protein [Isosphaeraceae bacterium]